MSRDQVRAFRRRWLSTLAALRQVNQMLTTEGDQEPKASWPPHRDPGGIDLPRDRHMLLRLKRKLMLALTEMEALWARRN